MFPRVDRSGVMSPTRQIKSPIPDEAAEKTMGGIDWRCVTPNAALGKAGISTVLALIRRCHATHKHSVSTCVYSARVLLMCFDVAAVVAWGFVCLFVW